MNPSLMTSVVHRFDRLLRYAHDSERELGIGAIVLFETDLDPGDDMLGGEYWTMGKIRESLRQVDETADHPGEGVTIGNRQLAILYPCNRRFSRISKNFPSAAA